MSQWNWYDAYGAGRQIERIEFDGPSVAEGGHVEKFTGSEEPDYLCSVRAKDELHAYTQATKWLEGQGEE